MISLCSGLQAGRNHHFVCLLQSAKKEEEVAHLGSEVEQLKLEHARQVEDVEECYEEELKQRQRDSEDEVAQLESCVAQYERKLGNLLARVDTQKLYHVSNNLPALVADYVPVHSC